MRGILSGGVWNGFLLGFVRGEIVPCRFCGGPDNDGHLFWECPHPPFVHNRESPEFRHLLLRDRSSCPRCLLWHGWLPALACAGEVSPWAATNDDVAFARLERLLGSYSEEIVGIGSLLIVLLMMLPLLMFLIALMCGLMVVLFLMSCQVLGLEGVVFILLKSGVGWFDRRWGHLELLPPGEFGVERCVLFDSVRGPLQSVQRAELWGVILALQCSSAVHLGVDNLNVVRHVSRILEGPRRPFELTFDGDLLTIIDRMVHQREVRSVKIYKVKGHAGDDLVAGGRVRVEDRIGNDLADRAADFGRRRVSDLVIDVRRRFLSACSSWYPVVFDLHRFFIAIARAASYCLV